MDIETYAVLSKKIETTPAEEVEYLTVAPTADNPNGLKFVILDSEPAVKYNGYLYIIKGV